MPAKIDFMFFDAGGGHRAAATALQSVIQGENRDWSIRLVNFQELLDDLDLVRRLTGVRIQDCYNVLLKKGWTLGSAQLLKVLHAASRLMHGRQVRALTETWRRETPDMVVSLIPNFNRALYEGLQAASPGAPFVTILTDLADYPPHFWIERQDQYVICGTGRAVAQALEIGVPEGKIFRTSGMILRPRFYAVESVDVAAERRKLGLDPERPTGLVLFGGQGSKVMLQIARRLQDSRRELQLIFICGHNEKLAAQLREMESRFPICAQGFTTEIPYFMQLADFFIGKPGPGSVSEAIKMDLPVIVQRNAWTLPQERYNADWITERGVGIVLENFSGINAAVENMLEAGRLERYHAAVRRIENRAVFEIPGILDEILSRS